MKLYWLSTDRIPHLSRKNHLQWSQTQARVKTIDLYIVLGVPAKVFI